MLAKLPDLAFKPHFLKEEHFTKLFWDYLRQAYLHNPIFKGLDKDLGQQELREKYRRYVKQGRQGDEQRAFEPLYQELTKGLTARKSVAEAPPAAFKPSSGNLRLDPRLQVELSFYLDHPTVQAVLEKIEEETKVPLTLDMPKGINKPFISSMGYSQVQAWSILKSMAELPIVNGTWEPDGEGYRLVQGEVDLPDEHGTSTTWLLILLLAPLPLIALLTYLHYRKQRKPG